MSDIMIQMVQGGLKWELLFTLFQLMAVGYILIYLKSLIVSEFAYRSFRNSLNICINTWVRVPTTTGHVDGQIVEVDRKRIVVETEDTRLYIPTKTFPDRDWYLVRKISVNK